MDKAILRNIFIDAVHGHWDTYREHYPNLSFQDIQWLHNEWFRYFPKQDKYNLGKMVSCFETFIPWTKLSKVLELGCHVGSLALAMLSRYPGIDSWTGLDISETAIENSIRPDKRYHPYCLSGWFYEMELPEEYDLFISAHTLEHMPFGEVKKCLAHAASKCPYMILEVPFDKTKQGNWKGHKSSHVLNASREDVEQHLKSLGYNFTYKWQGTRNWGYACKKV